MRGQTFKEWVALPDEIESNKNAFESFMFTGDYELALKKLETLKDLISQEVKKFKERRTDGLE